MNDELDAIAVASAAARLSGQQIAEAARAEQARVDEEARAEQARVNQDLAEQEAELALEQEQEEAAAQQPAGAGCWRGSASCAGSNDRGSECVDSTRAQMRAWLWLVW